MNTTFDVDSILLERLLESYVEDCRSSGFEPTVEDLFSDQVNQHIGYVVRKMSKSRIRVIARKVFGNTSKPNAIKTFELAILEERLQEYAMREMDRGRILSLDTLFDNADCELLAMMSEFPVGQVRKIASKIFEQQRLLST